MGIGFVVAAGFLPGGGGFCCANCSEAPRVVASGGFVDVTAICRGFCASGEGVRALDGRVETGLCTALGGASVDTLLICGRLTLVGDTSFCSNIPIKDVVGGMGVISKP